MAYTPKVVPKRDDKKTTEQSKAQLAAAANAARRRIQGPANKKKQGLDYQRSFAEPIADNTNALNQKTYYNQKNVNAYTGSSFGPKKPQSPDHPPAGTIPAALSAIAKRRLAKK